jgi:hypothetical protein
MRCPEESQRSRPRNVRKQRLRKKKTSAEEYLEIAPWQNMHIGHATYIVSTYQCIVWGQGTLISFKPELLICCSGARLMAQVRHSLEKNKLYQGSLYCQEASSSVPSTLVPQTASSRV